VEITKYLIKDVSCAIKKIYNVKIIGLSVIDTLQMLDIQRYYDHTEVFFFTNLLQLNLSNISF